MIVEQTSMTMPLDCQDALYLEVVRRDPAADSEHGRALARLWAEQRSQVIDRVFEIAQDSGRVAWHIHARTETVFEMANLLIWLSKQIVDHRLKGQTVADIDIADEQAALNSPAGMERIQNTARLVAERIWNRVYDELQQKYPLVETPATKSVTPRLPGRTPKRRQPGTKDNHFVPRFTVRPWSDKDGMVRELRRLSNGTIQSRLRPYARWGFEHFLYPQDLEDYFQLVESRAAGPYRQLLEYRPLTPDDRYFWISFLILQHLRTPAFMTVLAAGLRRLINAKRWAYPATPDALRRAYLTLFDDNKVFSTYYRQMDGRRWHMLVPSTRMSFPRTDVPLVIAGIGNTQGWRCIYPLSPEHCFQVGPEQAAQTDVPFALSTILSTEETIRLNRLLLDHSRRSLVVRTIEDPDEWSAALESARVRGGTSDEYRAWGPLDQ